MSTLSISPTFQPAAPRARRAAAPGTSAPTGAPTAAPESVRLTRRGRLLVLLVGLALVLGAMVALSGLATATRDAGTPPRVHVVEVQPGDTLYAIAGKLAGPGHVRDMVNTIEQLNSLPDASIQVGQKLAVPAG